MSRMPFEECAEMALVDEAKPVTDFLDGETGILEQQYRLLDDCLCYQGPG